MSVSSATMQTTLDFPFDEAKTVRKVIPGSFSTWFNFRSETSTELLVFQLLNDQDKGIKE